MLNQFSYLFALWLCKWLHLHLSDSAVLLVCRQPLLTNEKTQQDALLAVSSLVNNYCESSAGCAEDEEVQKVLDSLTGILGKDCDVNDSNFKQVSTHRLRVRSSKCAKFIHLCPILLLTILIRNAFQFLQIHVAASYKKERGGRGCWTTPSVCFGSLSRYVHASRMQILRAADTDI